MGIVIHDIKGNRYAYEHYRVGSKIKTKYIGPVDARGNIRALHDDSRGVGRVPVGTTTARLKTIYAKAVHRKEKEEVKPVKFKYKVEKRFDFPDRVSIDNKILDNKGNEVGVFSYDILKDKKMAYFDWIRINKSERGKGIPDEVTEQFVADMKKQGITDIQMTSIKSKEEYWKKQGWEIIPGHPEEGQMRYVGKK